MNKQDIINKIEIIESAKTTFAAELLSFTQDKNIPLADRWEVFEKASKNDTYINIHGWIWHSKIIEDELNLEWYDDFSCERRETVQFLNLIEWLGPDYRDEPITEEVIDRIKEEMLQSGYTGFCFDW